MLAHAMAMPPTSGRAAPPPDGRSAAGGAKSALPLGATILIVEDEVMIAWMIESILEDIGFTDIHMASSRSEAERTAAAAPPGLIISDINLGDGPDGVETAVAMRTATAIPVLFVTAYADDATRRRISDVLPDALILRKPMQAADLRDALHTLLGRKLS